MRLRPSITSHCILSVYLLSAAFLSIVVVANPIPIPSRTTDGKDIRISRNGSRELRAKDQFALFITGNRLAVVLEAQVVPQDSTNPGYIEQIISGAPPRNAVTGRIAALFETDDGVTAHFVFEEFFWEHYNVIRNVEELRTRTNALLEQKAKGFGNSTIGDPDFHYPIVIEDDLDWINAVFLYLTLIDQPGGNVPVLDSSQAEGSPSETKAL
ncbi:hypothetical protein GGU11DRAFT_811746 [Lentinula aff. detonsa]|nr:hypothetical protein GGU11DRAFT_811746 [Lentinula aff. detonsa]